jgi:hypothetical protein
MTPGKFNHKGHEVHKATKKKRFNAMAQRSKGKKKEKIQQTPYVYSFLDSPQIQNLRLSVPKCATEPHDNGSGTLTPSVGLASFS